MIKKKSKEYKKREIDLTGPEGNAFFLLGTARSLSRKLSLNWEAISKEMQAGDYENLIEVFDKYFGDYVDLIR